MGLAVEGFGGRLAGVGVLGLCLGLEGGVLGVWGGG